MTRLALATLVRKKTRTNSTTYGDTEMLVDANLMKDEIAGMIAAQRNEAFNIEKLENLVLDTRAYEYDDNVMNNLVRMEIMFAADGDYELVTFSKLHHYKHGTQESEIIDFYTNSAPVAFVRGKFVHILSGSIVAVTNGIRWIYKEFPEDLADLTDNTTDMLVWSNNTTPGFPREFHKLLATAISIEWKSRNNRTLSKLENDYPNDLQTAIENYAIPSIDEEIIGTLPPASATGDSGFDY